MSLTKKELEIIAADAYQIIVTTKAIDAMKRKIKEHVLMSGLEREERDQLVHDLLFTEKYSHQPASPNARRDAHSFSPEPARVQTDV